MCGHSTVLAVVWPASWEAFSLWCEKVQIVIQARSLGFEGSWNRWWAVAGAFPSYHSQQNDDSVVCFLSYHSQHDGGSGPMHTGPGMAYFRTAVSAVVRGAWW